MENLIFFILFLLSIININIKGMNNFYYDYMELKNTNSIKGIFVWMIIMSHYYSYYRYTNRFYLNRIILRCFGQKMVSLFLFYSGFGIYESVKNKGKKYIKNLIKKALALFLKSQIILILFLINNLYLGVKITFKQYILSIIFKKGIGNSNWFAFTIISYYLYSFIAFIFIKKKYYLLGILLISSLCFLHLYYVYNYYYPNSKYAIDNTLSFIFGFYYSYFLNNINRIIMKNDIFYFLFASCIIEIYYFFYSYKIRSIWTNLMTNSFFCLIVVLISMKIRFNNEFLNLLNSHSYSIYLLQRIVMKLVYVKKYFKYNELIRFFFEFVVILLISSIFDNYTSFIDNCFRIKTKK